MVIVYLGLGSNLGNKGENIRQARALLEKKCKVLSVSSLRETEPMYYTEQPRFLNGVAKIETNLTPEELLAFILSIEKKLGRIRKKRYGPRTIDLDILFYGDKIIDQKNLTIPHPKIQERAFVLEPLNELCPALTHPKLKKRIDELFVLKKPKDL